MGGDLRNMPISALFFAADREIFEETLVQVFDRPAAARLAIESTPGFGRERLTCRMTLLPLRDDLGHMNRLLGALAVTGKIGRAPRRLSITAKTLTELEPGIALVAPTAPLRPRDRQSGGHGNVVELPLSAD